LAHSPPHRWQTSAQAAQLTLELSLARVIAAAASEKISAQSMSRAMQRAIILTFSSCRQAVAQCSQASMH
jgi:hypothetical protein